MTTRELLRQLRMQDVRVWTEGDRLRVNAPENVLTTELQAELAARKSEIREILEAAAAKRSSLVPISPSGSRPVFYGVPADGDVFTYLKLSRELGPDQPFYAFEAPGIDGSEPPLTSIELLAARYLADLRAFQPEGPYVIGGFCLGGIVAFELARQLRAEGQEVALLALFESPSPNGLRSWRGPVARLRRRKAEILERVRALFHQPWPDRFAFVLGRLAQVLLRRPDPARASVFLATLQAAYDYVLATRMYPGRIVLFLGSQELSRRRDYLRQLDWAQVAAEGLEVKVGPDGCTDYNMMLVDPLHVRALADLLTPYLEQVPPRRGPSWQTHPEVLHE